MEGALHLIDVEQRKDWRSAEEGRTRANENRRHRGDSSQASESEQSNSCRVESQAQLQLFGTTSDIEDEISATIGLLECTTPQGVRGKTTYELMHP